MNKLFQRALTSLLLLAPAALAVQLSDLSPSMTRTSADDELTKDYAYRVLSDLSVRRIWNLDDNRKLTVDFDSKNGNLICIVVDYRKPVTLEEADKDAADIGKFEEAKWKKFPSDKAAKYHMGRSRAMKFKEGFMFQELTGANKCMRLTFYTSVPKENRRHLTEGSTFGGSSAMGNTVSGGAVKNLLKDEETRLYTPNKTDKPKDVAPKPRKVEVTEPEPIDEPEPEVVKEPEPEVVKEPVDTKPAKVAKKKEVRRSGLEEFLAKIGLDGLTPMQWGIGGGALLVLIIVISAVGGGSSRRKLEQRADALRRNSASAKATLRQSIEKGKKSNGLRLK